MSDIDMTLPGAPSTAQEGAIHQPIVVLRTTSNAGTLRFSLNGDKGLLRVDPLKGEVYSTPTSYGKKENEVGKISATIYVEDVTTGLQDHTRMQIDVFPSDHFDCYQMVEELCFWTGIKYRTEEDVKQDLVLGSLASPYLYRLCPFFNVNYTLIDEGFLSLIRPTSNCNGWLLATRSFSERNPDKTKLSGHITCTVEDVGGKLNGSKWEIQKDIDVAVLDVDNNPPKPQYPELNIRMPRMDFKKNDEIPLPSLLFTDEDGTAVNNYVATILNDNTNAFQPLCSSYPRRNKTAVRCKLRFTRDKVFASGKNTFLLQLNDTTLKERRISSTAEIPIHLIFIAPQPMTLASKMMALYPKPLEKIFRTAAPFARVTQPVSGKVAGCGHFQMVETRNGTKGQIFNITEDGGIVYVQDYKKLRNQRLEYVSLNISWIQNSVIHYDEIQVRIVNEPNQTCGNITRYQTYVDAFCSQYETANDCLRPDACALSTGGSPSVEKRSGPERCMWRGDKFAQNITHLYSTCTPDVDTCPDGYCDPLESLHEMICPQDCTTDALMPLKINAKTGRGIDEASGAVICHRIGGCTLIKKFEYDRGPQKKGKKQSNSNDVPVLNLVNQSNSSKQVRNVTGSRMLEYQMEKCGTFCVIGTGTGIFLLGSIITFIVVCWRNTKAKQMTREKYRSEDNHEMTAPLSVPIHENARSEPLSVNFQLLNSNFEDRTREIIKKYAPDAKWEFPRSQLVIEQTLGEGEFGRVLRAKAFNIGGLTGYTTVAVKTLKEDARDSELNDLLSEFQLLKEISHPNVISLLGVCTSPGGPVYLIIEYAEYGSLRNYLRRSRKLLGDSTEDAEAHYDEPKQRNVTPKDLLSFGWQICNGMAYLSDIKLVHRDLAARNVLLAENKICKISDFGLTRDVYEDNAYLKRSKGRVPVKWMAPESLADHIYTSKSDVWSFGILIWELVTLGATPYPGIAVQSLFHLLKQGYRMERPDNCSPALYEIMKSCWHLDPELRPSFHELLRRWERMLQDKTEYVNLSNNAIHNRGYFLSPFEEKEENFVEENVGLSSLNDLSRSESYKKCAEIGKTIDEELQEQSEQSSESTITQGYETPVKAPNKLTPTNEDPEEYTDMSAK